MQTRTLLLPLSLGLFALAGCQSGGSPLTEPAPAGPATDPAAGAVATLPSDVAVLGAWEIAIDPATNTAEVAELRTGTAFGDNYWLNATGYLAGVPCRDCFRLESVSRDVDGHMVITAAVRHPFAPGDVSLPISGTNRLDLHVFDAQLLVAGDLGNENWDFGGGNTIVPSRLVLDADGYSDLLTPTIQAIVPGLTSSAYPYVTIGEDPTGGNVDPLAPTGFTDVQAPTGHNVFAMGSEHLATFTLGLEEGDQTTVRAFFTASYGVSSPNRAARLTPRYALPEYNTKAPWKVTLDIPDATNDLTGGDPGSTAAVEVKVWDWQPGAPIDDTLSTLDAIRASSDVASVEIAVPGVMTAAVDLGAPVSGTGPLDDPLVYQGSIINNASADAGDFVAIVQVTDTRAPGLNSGGQTDGLSNQTGLQLDPVNIDIFRTYQVAPVEVEGFTGRVPLSIAITPDTRQIIFRGPGEAITFTAIGTYATPPLTEDITSTVTWLSSQADAAIFAGDNILEGVEMGQTFITAELNGVTSNEMDVIVKPEEDSVVPRPSLIQLDSHQGTGDIYATVFSPPSIMVLSTANAVIGGWNVLPADLPTSPEGHSVDEVNGLVYVGDQTGPTTNVAVYNLAGVKQRNFTMSMQIHHIQDMELMDDGTLWSSPFCCTADMVYEYDTITGAITDSFKDQPAFWAINGSDTKDNLFYIANPGGRGSGEAVVVTDPAANDTLAFNSIWPPNMGQNDRLAVDRDGFIHNAWNAQPGVAAIIQVYEFIPPSTLNVLYEYSPVGGVAGWYVTGITVSRPDNVVAMHHIFGDYLTMWD